MKALARRTARQRGWGDWEGIPEQKRYEFLAAEIAPHLTRYLKRVRKEAQERFRYCAVVERHEDGFPHLHLLLHEPTGPVRWETLSGQWKLGFSNWKLVKLTEGNIKPAFYVAKYLAKHAGIRIRASVGYGRGGNTPPSSHSTNEESGVNEERKTTVFERSERSERVKWREKYEPLQTKGRSTF